MKKKKSEIKAADELISSPDFLMMVQNPDPTTARKLSGSGPFKKFAKAAKIPDEQRFQWVMNAIRAEKAAKNKENE